MSEWLERKGGVDIYEPDKVGRRTRRGYKVFLDTPSYTNEERLVIHGFYVDTQGNFHRHSYNRKTKGKDGKPAYVKNYYMVSLPKALALELARAIAGLVGGEINEVEPDADTALDKKLKGLGYTV